MAIGPNSGPFGKCQRSAAAYVAEAILKKPDRVEEDTMTGVEPSVSTDPLTLPH